MFQVSRGARDMIAGVPSVRTPSSRWTSCNVGSRRGYVGPQSLARKEPSGGCVAPKARHVLGASIARETRDERERERERER